MIQDTEICVCGHDYDTHKRPGDRACKVYETCPCTKFRGAKARKERNEAARARNEILRDICGTSAAAARRDMGI